MEFDMWKIRHIFDGDFGCEEQDSDEMMVSITLANEAGDEKLETVPDAWLVKNGLEVGSKWPDYSGLVLETADLVIKKAVWEDWPQIYRNLWRHAESAKYMLWDVTTSEDEAQKRMERTLRFQKYHKYSFFIYEKSSNNAIGFVGMMELQPGIFEDIGLALGPDYTCRGYGTQVLTALLKEAKRCGARKFIGTCRKQNLASHALLMRCGLQFSHDEDRVDSRDGSAYVLEFNEIRF